MVMAIMAKMAAAVRMVMIGMVMVLAMAIAMTKNDDGDADDWHGDDWHSTILDSPYVALDQGRMQL